MSEAPTIADLERRLAAAEAALSDKADIAAALRRSEELRRIAIEGGPMGTWRWNLREQRIWGDAVFLNLWGFPPSDEPRPLSEFTDRMSPQGLVEMGEMIPRAVAAGEEFDGQLAVVSGPTGGRWVRWRGCAEREQPWILNGVSFDVTDQRMGDERLRESEARHRALVEGVPHLVWRAVDGGLWTWSSPQWSAHTGQSEAESLGHGWLAALHPDDRDGAIARWQEAQAAGAFVAEYRLRNAAQNRDRWFQTRATPVLGENRRIVEWLGTSTDVDDLRAYQERQRVMVAELQHRTRNLLGMVRAIAGQTLRASATLADFEAAFNDRLAALSRVQGLLSRADDEPITLDAVLRAELDALGAWGMPERVRVTGPKVRLRKRSVEIVALALHEVATNARKYGALAGAAGRLAVTWEIHTAEDGQRLVLEWRETGLERPLEARRPVGYGRELIEKALPYVLQARTTYTLGETELVCTVDLPIIQTTEPNAQ